MIKPSKQAIESAARIGFNEKPFVDLLTAELDDVKSKMVLQPDDVQLRNLQGRAQALTSIVEFIKAAPELTGKA